jgi:signal transduction histidine kinase/CheY-like chemotaxis protein
LVAHSIGARYGIVLATFLVAAGVRWALIPVFGSALPFITFYPGIMLSAWFGGLWPGVLMTVLGAAAALAFWPVGSFPSAISVLSLSLYLFNGFAISGLTEFLHRARRKQDELHEVAASHQAEVERLLRLEHEARTAAETANRAKDDFLATLSHELRTPLTAIIGWVSLLRQRPLDGAQLSHAIEVIGRNAHMQAQLVNDLLDVSRIVAGKLTLDRDEVNLARLTREIVDGMQEQARAKSLQVSTRLDPGAAWVHGDAVRLQQVVANLCSNAMKFTPPGGRIDVELERQAANARLVVRDTGEGIDEADLTRIFGRFEQETASASRRSQGLGLGLAICRYLVNAHGGDIRAHSAGKGQGATFTVDLPLLAVRAGVKPARRTGQRDRRAAAPRLDGFRVLVVDDHDDARQTVGMVLQQYGAHVVLAASAREALEAFSQSKIDVLVSDIGMPQADGYDLIARVRAVEREARATPIPAVALTAYGSKEDRERALAAGFQTHVLKPIDPTELGAVIAELRAPVRRRREGQ